MLSLQIDQSFDQLQSFFYLVQKKNYFMMLSCFISAVDPLVGSIANQYINDRQEHDKIAKEWTKRFAT